MNDELHAARLVEEPLDDDRVLRRHRSQAPTRLRQGSRRADRPRPRRCRLARLSQRRALVPDGSERSRAAISRAQTRDGGRQRVRSARRFAEPEGNVWRLALGVLHADRPALDALNAIGRVAELENVARHALDGEILVHRADGLVLGLEQHLVVGGVGDRAAGGQRGRPRAAPAAQNAIDRVAMDERAAPAPAGGEALAQHARRSRRNPLAPANGKASAAQPIIKLRFRPILRRDFRDHLLREHVERPLRDRQAVELAATDAVEKRCAFDEIVARERKQPPLRRAADRVTGTADALQEGCDRARRTDLTNEIDVADIDAELERGGRHQGFQFAALQPLFGGEPELLRHAAVMRGDGVFAETIAELARDAFGHAPRVDEHERRAVLAR